MTLTLPQKSQLFLKGHYGWLSFLIWIMMIGPVAALEMRVAIIQGASQVTIGSSTQAKILDGTGHPLGNLEAMQGFFARSSNTGITVANKQASQIWIQPNDEGYVYIGEACAPSCGGHWYRGKVKLVRTGKGLIAVNYVDLEQYLASVLGKEMYPSWPQEALKSQAVAARSYALYKRQRQTNRVYDVDSTTTYQVYDGIDGESLSTQAAVAATSGQVLTYQGKIIEAVFHSASGGHTENSENVWIGVVPYLRGVPDFDQGTPAYQWAFTLTATQLRERLPGVGNIISMMPVTRTPQGRVVTMKIVGDGGSRMLKGDQLRNALGLKSTLFTVTPQMGLVASTTKASPIPVAFEITGRGFGHGLGLSQWGAYNMAMQGQSYQQILQHYYQGTTLSKVEVK